MMNHARENWYQPGALIYRASDNVYTGAGNLSESTTSAWTAFSRALTLSYTPTTDCVALLTALIASSHSQNDQSVLFRIYESATAAALVGGYAPSVQANIPTTLTMSSYMALTSGTAYTFAVQYYISAATLTILELGTSTFLQLLVFKKP